MSFTAEIPILIALPPAVPREPILRLRVDQYHEMFRAGILTEDDAVELLEGWLVQKMTKSPPHCLATQLTREMLEEVLPAGWIINVQEPITTATSEPEPDVSVIRGARRDYADRHPGPEEVALIVEVADSTLARDRGFKKRLYACSGIPVYWIVNLLEMQLEVYSQPTGLQSDADYRQRQDFRAGDIVPIVIAGNEIGNLPVDGILP